MSFTESLREHADSIWSAWHEHPFIRGIGDGSLEEAKFKYWLRQDYLYLIDYSRVFAYGGARAQKLEVMQKFAGLMDGILNTEMELHRQYAKEFGIELEDLEREEKSPSCQAYTDFLVRTASEGSVPEILAVLLPCLWGFLEIGERLVETGDTSEENLYRDWIEMYSSDDFRQLTDWARELMEDYAEDLSDRRRQRLKELFVISSRFEYKFWDMAENLEEWEV
ncbi:thiaminase II [Halarsenatibacter silvermanii]|uniref:Aminopyrimidine aminohydrolase n=1 Tax=Halarsenatibacter silvermanii TaxID=321763 RepID=A0A1G9QAU0_9FIRM|nr:thiaminase II [Halarsenatibacter silvermanii]SDM08184.1 thiaminase (transcriptional activator TenA) [Halarsenatibacter silvermanii]